MSSIDIQVPDLIFETVRNNFLDLNGNEIDEEIRNVIMRWKEMPVLDEVCPRWSCQSHSSSSGMSNFEIIFVTRNNGNTILYKIFNEICKEMVDNYGLGYLAATSFNIVNLLHESFMDTYHPHIVIGSVANGDLPTIQTYSNVWLKILDKLENGNL